MKNLLIGQKAPTFNKQAVANGKIINNFSLDLFEGKYVLFFFYPLDFTFVCPTELHAFQDQLKAFEERNAQVVGCSVDIAFSHLPFFNTPKNKGGIEGVTFPLVADVNKSIARDYRVLNEEEGIAYRGLFLIDTKGIIRHLLINDLPLGRSVDEALRIIDALIFHEANGEVCPANWKSGEKSMKPDQEGLHSYYN